MLSEAPILKRHNGTEEFPKAWLIHTLGKQLRNDEELADLQRPENITEPPKKSSSQRWGSSTQTPISKPKIALWEQPSSLVTCWRQSQ